MTCLGCGSSAMRGAFDREAGAWVFVEVVPKIYPYPGGEHLAWVHELEACEGAASAKLFGGAG